MIQMIAAPNSATPTNSRTRRDTVDRLTSNLHDDRQYERSPARPLPKEAPQFDAQFLLDQPWIGPLLDARLLHNLGEHPGAVGEERLAVLHDEAAGNDVGDPFKRASLPVDRDHRHHQAVLRQMTAIAQHLVRDLAGQRSVDQDPSDRDLLTAPDALAIELEQVAVLDEQHFGPGIAAGEDPRRDARVLR